MCVCVCARAWQARREELPRSIRDVQAHLEAARKAEEEAIERKVSDARLTGEAGCLAQAEESTRLAWGRAAPSSKSGQVAGCGESCGADVA